MERPVNIRIIESFTSKCLLLVVISLLSNSLSAQDGLEIKPVRTDSLLIDTISRSFKYYVPEGISANPGLIFLLHGSGGNPDGTRDETEYLFEKESDSTKSSIILYPLGYDNHWNDCRAKASYKANTEDVNDIEFFKEMISYFSTKFNADTTNVFAAGMSNGGHMIYKLGFEMPTYFKGLGAWIANIPSPEELDCKPEELPVSMIIINGTKDVINPHEGGWVVLKGDSTRGKVRSSWESFNYWKEQMQCIPNYSKSDLLDLSEGDSLSLVHHKYACEDQPLKVELIEVIDGTHRIPLVGVPLMMDFFERLRND